jgi:hypothetical protein
MMMEGVTAAEEMCLSGQDSTSLVIGCKLLIQFEECTVFKDCFSMHCGICN